MKAIILAAGIGSRLKDSNKTPKCLLRIGNQSLLERQIKILNNLKIHDIRVVIGSKGKCWTKKNIEKIKSITRNVIINTKNTKFKRPYSLHCGLHNIEENDDILIFDGDTFLEQSVIEKIIKSRYKSVISSIIQETKHIETGAKIIDDMNNRVLKVGYGLNSNCILSSIIKVNKSEIQNIKKLLNKSNFAKDMSSSILNEWVNMTKVFHISFNPKYFIKPKPYVEDVSKHNEDSDLNEIKGDIFRKKAVNLKEKLINEAKWILNLPDTAKKHFPKIIGYNFKTMPVYYDMRYYSFETLSELVIQNRINIRESIEIIKKIIDFLFKEIYSLKIKKPKPYFIRMAYIDKVYNRLKNANGVSKLFDKVVQSKILIINGKKYNNAFSILEKISNDAEYLSTLEPPYVSLFHGDFRMNNILINKEKNDFILIDPRGTSSAGSLESDKIEDFAKLFATNKGYYDLFKRGMFDLEIKENRDKVIIKYNLKNLSIYNKFNRIYDQAIRIIAKHDGIKRDSYWKKRLLFIGALLIIAIAPFQLRSVKDEKFVIAYYARGIELLNKFIEKYPLSKDRKYNIINLNTPQEYLIAKKYFNHYGNY